jgi:hypothetical protein
MEIPDSEIQVYLLPSSKPPIKNEGVDETFDECVCFECSKEPIVSLNCGHKYHKECISKWIETCEMIGPTCPICRSEMIRMDYKFWFKLGRETCNMRRWSDYCDQIISANFGKSSKYAKLFPIHSPFLGVQAHLDSLIQQSYDLDEDTDFNKHLQQYLKTSERVNCCDVFYNIDTITEPHIPCHTGKYPKKITQQQKQYIDAFRNRLKVFLNYLDYIVDNMKMPKNMMQWKETTGRNSMKDFITSVNKVKKWCDKLNLLDELNLS